MQEFKLETLGFELTFKADTEPERLEKARELLEERFEKLKQHGKHLGKDKLLAFLALGLAEDLVKAQNSLNRLQKNAHEIVQKIETQLPS